MQILIDTNVLLDYLAKREPFFDDARQILAACSRGNLDGIVAAHSLPNIIYIMRKYIPLGRIKRIIIDLCSIVEIESIDAVKLHEALHDQEFNDFEDCLQYQCALSGDVDYIVTRNPHDFRASSIPVISPHRLCILINQ